MKGRLWGVYAKFHKKGYFFGKAYTPHSFLRCLNGECRINRFRCLLSQEALTKSGEHSCFKVKESHQQNYWPKYMPPSLIGKSLMQLSLQMNILTLILSQIKWECCANLILERLVNMAGAIMITPEKIGFPTKWRNWVFTCTFTVCCTV